MRTAVSLRGEEPPANVLRSSYTWSLNVPVSEHESGFVVWTWLAGKYKVLPSRQPHLLGGKWEGKNQQLVETTFPTSEMPLSWHLERASNTPMHGKAVGNLLKRLVTFPSLPPLPSSSFGSTSASPPGSSWTGRFRHCVGSKWIRQPGREPCTCTSTCVVPQPALHSLALVSAKGSFKVFSGSAM